jgi:hypothetical protein
MTLSVGAVQLLLFVLFAGLTAILAAIIGPTYDNIVVPELQPSALYPSPFGGPSFLAGAAAFSTFLLGNLVDPAIALVGFAVALAYLGRSFFGRWAGAAEPLVARLILAVVLANFTLPLAASLIDLGGAAYPIIDSWDKFGWEHWENLAGYGEVQFSWDNGALAFVITFALFTMVLLLAAAIALRNAMMGVLLVLLPVFTLLWPVPALAPLARRGWLLFGELTFLPCVLVIPLELAVGAPSVLLLLGYLTVAVGSPALISLAGAQLTSVGFPSAGGAVSGSFQRGLAVASQAGRSYLNPIAAGGEVAPALRSAAGGASRTLGSAAFPASIPLLAGEFLGRGASHLLSHLPQTAAAASGRSDRFPAVQRGASVGRPRG